MSNLCKKFKKEIEKKSLRFPCEMYNNVVGSLIITNYILAEDKPELKDIIKQWKKIKKNGLDFWLDDADFIPKVLGIFNLEPQYGYFAMIQSEFNVLFLPYINDELLPIREDGIYPATARNNAKIYPIVEKDNAIRGCNNVRQGNKEIN